MNFMQIMFFSFCCSHSLAQPRIKSQWEIFILVINGSTKNGSRKAKPFPRSVLIVYSSFSRVYRELLTCLKCSSFRFTFCSRNMLWRRKEMNKHLQASPMHRSGAFRFSCSWPHGGERPDDDPCATARLTIDKRTFYLLSSFAHVSISHLASWLL